MFFFPIFLNDCDFLFFLCFKFCFEISVLLHVKLKKWQIIRTGNGVSKPKMNIFYSFYLKTMKNMGDVKQTQNIIKTFGIK